MAVTSISNVASLSAQNNLNKASASFEKHAERLASGARVNSGADDAAGLAIIQTLTAQSRSTQVASRNTLDGVSAVQTAEGALGGVQENLSRLRELAVQSSNGTLSDQDRAALQEEANGLVAEIQRTSEATEFNGRKLLEGSTTEIQVGSNAGSENRVSVDIAASTASALGVDGLDISSQAAAQSAIDDIDTATERVNENRAGIGAAQNRLSSAFETSQTTIENLLASTSRIRDTDVASEAAGFAADNIRREAGVSVLAQANFQQASVLRLLG